MPSAIFTLIEHPESALQTLAAARQLALLVRAAKIDVLAISMPPDSTLMPAEELLTLHPASDITLAERNRLGLLRHQFNDWAAEFSANTVACVWHEKEGLCDTLVGEWGRRSDFVVLNRQVRCNRAPERLAMQAALFDTNRPVLIAPPGDSAPFGENIAIAWREDKRTERAILAALPLLRQAKQVFLFAGRRPGAPPPKPPELLTGNGIVPKLQILPVGISSFGKTLLNAAHDVGADLIVMGAYTHNPWRELILGGVTSTMIAQADLPVLMRH